jgi:hypothetical protein
MSENAVPNALKHGAFSEVLILPGEVLEEFEALKDALFKEHKPDGISEERALMAIAKALWQERRLALYQHVQHVVHVRAGVAQKGPGPHSVNEAIERFRCKLRNETYVPPPPEELPPKSAEESLNEELRELSKLLTLDQLEKELEVESRLQAKIDRLFKRFFQLKAMKQMAGLTDSKPVPRLTESKGELLQDPAPVLELTAEEPN